MDVPETNVGNIERRGGKSPLSRTGRGQIVALGVSR